MRVEISGLDSSASPRQLPGVASDALRPLAIPTILSGCQTPLISLILWLNWVSLMADGQKIDSSSTSTQSIGTRFGSHRRPLIVPAWIRSNGFILGLFGVVILAFLFPQPGARNGWLHPDLISDFGIALILFLQGLSMALEKVRRGTGSWRLHVIIQVFTFVIFPIIGLGFQTLPIMFYHPFQLLVNGLLANQWAKEKGV